MKQQPSSKTLSQARDRSQREKPGAESLRGSDPFFIGSRFIGKVFDDIQRKLDRHKEQILN